MEEEDDVDDEEDTVEDDEEDEEEEEVDEEEDKDEDEIRFDTPLLSTRETRRCCCFSKAETSCDGAEPITKEATVDVEEVGEVEEV